MRYIHFILFYLIGIINCLNNGLGLTPPMGWNGWNKLGCNVTEKIVIDIIDKLNSSGLAEAGYTYITLDDGWQIDRFKNGTIIVDTERFPNGIKSLADYAHSKGLKFGLTSDSGFYSCSKRPGSLGFEGIDAAQYAEWGVDYLKYENCYNIRMPMLSRFQRMKESLNKTGRNIFFAINTYRENYIGEFEKWATNEGNSWRTSSLLTDDWREMLKTINRNDKYNKLAGIGGWNDPGNLQVGNGGMTIDEYKVHFGLWAISKAPLIIGTDITNINKETIDILTNPEVIAINQDPLGQQGMRLIRNYINYTDYNLTPADVEVADCIDTKEQQWFFLNGTIRQNNDTLCLEIPNITEEINSNLRVNLCKDSNVSEINDQKWIYNPKKKSITSKLFTNYCAELTDPDYLTVKPNICSNIENQKWTYYPKKHSFRAMGKCLTTYMNDEVTEIWAANLVNDTYAVLLLNRGNFNNYITFNWTDIGYKGEYVHIRDLWERKDIGIFMHNYSIILNSHSSQLLKITPYYPITKSEGYNLTLIYILIALVALMLLIVKIYFYYVKVQKQKYYEKIDVDERNKIKNNPE